MACPNINSPEWKSLVDTIGENNAWKEFLKFGEIPDSSIYESRQSKVFKSGVDELFSSTPELASIGTPQQYSQYLDTIFPDSKVKDIVYHRTYSDWYKTQNFSKDVKPVTGIGENNIVPKKQDAIYFYKYGKEGVSNVYGKYVLAALVNIEKLGLLGNNGMITKPIMSKEEANTLNKKIEEKLLKKRIQEFNDKYPDFIKALEKENIDVKNLKGNKEELFWELVDKYKVDTSSKGAVLFDPFYSNRLYFSDLFGRYIEVTKDTPYYDRVSGKRERGRTVFEEWDVNEDGLISEGWVIVKDPSQIHILGSKQDIEGFKKFVSSSKKVLYSIRTKSTEEISKGIDLELIKSDRELKYTSFITSRLINTIGDISPNKKLEMPPNEAFKIVKKEFEDVVGSLKLALSSFIKSDEDLQEMKNSSLYDEILKNFQVIGWVSSFKEFQTSLQTYSEIVNKFDRYKEFVIAELAHKGIRLVKDRIELIVPQDVSNKEEDDGSDDTQLPSEEINTQKFDTTAFETNPYDTATLRVKALMQTIKTGEYELGIPLYADLQDVMSDMLYAGAAMDLSGYTDVKNKLKVFKSELELRKDGRPYLSDLLSKIGEFEKDGKWDTINQILTFASKAFANETLLLYTLDKQGANVFGVRDIKTISSNRDKIEDQVSKDFLSQHKSSNFFKKTATGEFYPKKEKVEQLDKIRKEGKVVTGQAKLDKFIEFFNVLGIQFTNKEMEYMAPRLAKALRKGKSFDILFADGQLLDNIYKSFNEKMTTAFKDDYGFQDEKSSMKALALLYYDVNPGKYNIVSSKTADGKSKFLYIQPNYVEVQKREWDNSDETAPLTNTALARPNKSFWEKVKKLLYNFTLGYFNGLREQEKGKDGKVRKNFTKKEQTVTMLLKHQENLDTGTYIMFTLSDKVTTVETKMSKEFFVNSKNTPVGLGNDYVIKDGQVAYTNSFKQRVYNSFVEPEVSRILSAIKHGKDINLENFDISSKLFYFIPRINIDPSLEDFRKDLYSGNFTLEQIKEKYASQIGNVIVDEFSKSSDEQIKTFLDAGIIKKNQKGEFSYPLFKNGYSESDYVNAFRKTGATGIEMARLMMMDMKFNYMNAQIKSIQFLKFDPMNAFKPIKGMNISSFENISNEDKIKLVNSTWDEFSKRAAALVAPGSQGNWTWQYGKNEIYSSQQYNAVTVNDIGTITDAQEFVTMQEHIDYLMSEGKLPTEIWESIHKKIVSAKPGGYYELSKKELEYVFTPVKPVHANNMKMGKEGEEDITGLNRVDYIKTSRFPLIPEQEAGSERDKLRQWMEKNNIQSLNFVSGKKLGRPSISVTLFDKDGNFIEPSENETIKATQVLSRDGLRNQQEIPHQKDEISTITQMNRTLFDGLLESNFSISSIKSLTGYEAKAIKERIRSRLFDMKAAELQKEIGNLSKSHRGIHKLLKDVILNDTTGSYTENDLKSIELNNDGFFKMDIEFQFKQEKFQGLINAMINRNVMLKVDGTSFVQVSGVGAKYNFSSLSKGVKSGIIWVDSYAKNFKKGTETKLEYIQKDSKGNIKPAQVIVSQYLRDKKGNLIDLSEYITEKDGIKILDTSKFTSEMFQLIASRIPNQSHVSMLPVEVVGFLPDYMENTIIVPDGITDQMGSDFDVDKLYAYTSKIMTSKNEEGVTTYSGVDYDISNIEDVNKLNKDQLEQLYRDIHWMVLTHPDTYEKITKSVEKPEVKEKVKLREEQLKKYNISPTVESNLPLDFMTSINRYTDNKSGKSGVSIFANLISAQADMQDKVIKLGMIDEEGKEVDHPKPIKIKLFKNSKDILNLKYLGKTGTSTSFLGKERSISDNLNIQFNESVDNAKNQFLKEFGWDEKTMGAVGILEMFTDSKGRGVPIDFAMDLTSQPALKKLSEKVEQKQDSFGEYDFNAIRSSIGEIQDDIIKYVETNNLLGVGTKAASHFEDPNRDNVLDPETLSDMWLVGQVMSRPKEERDVLLKQIMQDFNKKYGPSTYKSVDDLMLKYFESQYDALNLFERLEDTGRELMTILGSVYTYTKGIGPNVYATKQKLDQLNKLAYSSNFINIENIAGKVKKDDNGTISIIPQGEIGSSIENSLLFAQSLYKKLFPISTGQTSDAIATQLLGNQGIKKDEVGKQKYINTFKNVFNAIKSYMYTVPGLELFDNVRVTRNSLINGDSSIGKRVIELRKQPEFSKNGFLKNIEVDVDYNGSYILSFRAPFGTEIDDKAAISGFYQLATHKSEEIRQIAKDFALYPFATGDAGNIGRFIPVDYYLSDKDFSKAMRNMADSFAYHMSIPGAVNGLVQQIVQNNPELYAPKFNFSTSDVEGITYNSLFKKILSSRIGEAEDLSNVKEFSFTLGDFEKNEKAAGLVASLKVKLSDVEISYLKEQVIDATDAFKYPPYILINDSYTSGFERGSRSTNYLYKRVSSILDPIAKYERINILGYKNIKEYEFDNSELRSVIKDNAVDPIDEEMMPEKPDMSYGMTPEMFEQYEPTEKLGVLRSMSEITNHSGGAIGADSAWDAIGKEFGVVNHQHYYYGSKTPKGNVELTKDQLDEGVSEMKKAAVILNKSPKKLETINLLARNWFQVKNADQIVAIAPIADNMKSVEGGTGWAVAMAQINNKEINVFNQKDNFWYTWNGESFIKSETPILKKNFAGIGTRELTTKGKEAIQNVYEKTQKSLGEPEVKPTIEPVEEVETKPTEKLDKVIEGDIFNLPGIPVITTNLGGVHGAGLAQLAKAKGLIKQGDGEFKATDKVVQLPVKKVWSDSMGMNNNMELLKESLRSLIKVARENPTKNYLLPLAGLGHGEGSVNEIMPLLISTISASPNISLVLPAENINLGRQGTVRKDTTREKMPAIKEELAKVGLVKPIEQNLSEEQPAFTPEVTEYKGTNYYVFGTEEEGDMIVHAIRKDGKMGEVIKNKDLKSKVITKKLEDTHPEWVVTLTNMQYSPRYLVMPAGEVVSLTPTNYGKQITSDDVVSKVMAKFNSKLEDKVVIEQKAPVTGEKPTFTHNGITVDTEFKLSAQQEDALKKMIDFVEQRSVEAGEYTNTYTLEGYAGTGKTSIVGVMEKYMDKKKAGVSFVYMAPTHAATVALGLNTVKYGSKNLPMTVQSGVRYDKAKEVYLFTKKVTDRAKGIKNVIVLDEASMLANKDFTATVAAAENMGYKVIFMGDPKQIPEVMPGINKKELAKAFANPNKSALTTVFRTKDNNILKILTNIRNNVEFEEYTFESTDSLKQLKRGDFNAELIDDLKNNLEDVTIINYTNAGVAKANQEARRTLGFSGELKEGEKIVGYLGSETKQIEKGHLANSISYMVNRVKKEDDGVVNIDCSSNLLSSLIEQGMKGFPDKINFKYLQLSSSDTFDFNLSNEQIANNKEYLKDKLRQIHQLNLDYQNKRISYPAYLSSVNGIRAQLADYNTGGDYIYNPNIDQIEAFDSRKHAALNSNLQMKKGVDFGYAITVHKSQGMTIPIVYFDTTSLDAVSHTVITRDSKPFNTEKNALYYVGMSRASRKLVVPLNDGKKVPSTDKFSNGSQTEQFDLLAWRSKMDKEKAINELFGLEKEVSDTKSLLNTIYSTTSPLYKEILKTIGQTGGVNQLTFILDRTISSPGEYLVTDKTIKINPDLIVNNTDSLEIARQKIHEVIMHELLHHVTADLLMADPKKLTPEQQKWVKSISNLFDNVQSKILADPKHRESLLKAIEQSNKEDGILSASDKSLYYGLTNKYDFISMLMTDPEFREFMNNTKYDGQKSILDRFIEILSSILKSFGIQVKEDSVLKEGVTNIVGLIQSRQGKELTPDNGAIQKSIATSSKAEFLVENFDDILKTLNIKTVC